MGSCALCRENDDLKKSHLLPKSAYRVIGKSKRQKASPILIRALRDVASPSDYQYVKHLLCADCEQKFSDKEDIVAKYWFRKPGFLLRNQLRQVALYESDGGRRYYPGYPPIGLQEDDLYYFALSLLWRACQGAWGDYPGLDILTEYVEEDVRRYLNGDAVAPKSVKALVFVDWAGKLEQIMTLPISQPGRVQIVLLGLCIELHIDVLGNGKVVKDMNAADQKVYLMLDKTRCEEVFGYVHYTAHRLKSLAKVSPVLPS